MRNIRQDFATKGFDESTYKKYLANHQAEYIRKRLRVVYLYHQGGKIRSISRQLGVNEGSIRQHLIRYIEGGFEVLCKRIERQSTRSLLSEIQLNSFKEVVLQSRPFEVGLEGNIWTGKVMCDYIKNTYGVIYRKGIYDLLERLGLSHQKAHADYGNAKKEDQIAFINELKETLLGADEKTAVLKFDEFSVSTKTSTYYGWAQKNTRPKVVTDEKK